MFKATGVQIAIAAALLISVSPPALSDPAGCASESGGCNRGEERDPNAKADFDVREAPEPEEPEKPEVEQPEGEETPD
jgi:hypothetical protein